MGSHGRSNRGVASQTSQTSIDRPSTLQLRIKSEPLTELSLSAISISEVSEEGDRTTELPITSESQPASELSSIPQISEDATEIEASGDGDENVILSRTPQFNLQDAISKLVENSKFKPSDINTDPSVALRKLSILKTPVIHAAVRSKNGKSRDPEQWEKLNLFLYILASLDTVTPEFSNTLKLRLILEFFINLIYNFPQEYSNISQALIDKIEGQNGFQTPPSPPALNTNIESATSNSRKRRSLSDETPTSSKKSRNNSLSSPSNVVLPPSDHPIWGDNGIMRGLVRDGTSIKLIEEKSHTFKKEFKRFGHNDLTVGACWPKQIVALRDGAHGSSQGGISGTAETGAYSIIISKHYEGFDQDLGNTIYYSAPGAKDSTSKEPDSEKTGVKALRASIETRNPVRVLRAAGCAWDNGPAAGIRYDGLYRVMKGDVGTNGKGGKFWLVTLKRLENQDPIKVHLPDLKTIDLFERVKEGY